MKIYIYDNGFANYLPLVPTTDGLVELFQTLNSPQSAHDVICIDEINLVEKNSCVLIVHPSPPGSNTGFTLTEIANNANLENCFVLLVSSNPGGGMLQGNQNIRWHEYPVSNIDAVLVEKFTATAELGKPAWSLFETKDADALVAYYLLLKTGIKLPPNEQEYLLSRITNELNFSKSPTIENIEEKLKEMYFYVN